MASKLIASLPPSRGKYVMGIHSAFDKFECYFYRFKNLKYKIISVKLSKTLSFWMSIYIPASANDVEISILTISWGSSYTTCIR